MSTERPIDQCQCGWPLHATEGGKTTIYAQKPITPGPSSLVRAADLGEARVTLGLQQGTLVHDVHVEADRLKDRHGACMLPLKDLARPDLRSASDGARVLRPRPTNLKQPEL